MDYLIPKDFDYDKYLKKYKLNSLLGEQNAPLNASLKETKPVNFSSKPIKDEYFKKNILNSLSSFII